MSLVALLVLNSILVTPATSISCYTCESTYAKKCTEIQKETPCDSKKGEDTCITVLYKDKFHKNDQYVQHAYMAKSCVQREDCSLMCKSLEETGHRDCKETCCHDNLCNANMEKNVAFHGYFKNGSVIHNKNVLIIVVMVHIVSVIIDHRFSS